MVWCGVVWCVGTDGRTVYLGADDREARRALRLARHVAPLAEREAVREAAEPDLAMMAMMAMRVGGWVGEFGCSGSVVVQR